MNALTLELYKAKEGKQKGRWRWRLKASNGRIKGDSGEGYVQKWRAIKEWNKIVQAVLDQKVRIKE